MSSTNRDLVSQAIAAIPLWQAFLDQKEAEQDALLAEVRFDKKEQKGPLSALTSRFRLRPKNEQHLDQNVPTERPLTEKNDPSHKADSAASLEHSSLFDESDELDSVVPHSDDDSVSRIDASPEGNDKERELDASPEGDDKERELDVSPEGDEKERELDASPEGDDQKLKEEDDDYKFDDLF